MSTTRLYTEEQVRSMLDKMEVIYSLEDLTPIELPSDEEMKEYVYDNITPPSLDKGDGVEQMYFDTGFYVGFREFAKWIKDKILNK